VAASRKEVERTRAMHSALERADSIFVMARVGGGYFVSLSVSEIGGGNFGLAGFVFDAGTCTS